MGQVGEMHLCSECAAKQRSQYMPARELFSQAPAAWSGFQPMVFSHDLTATESMAVDSIRAKRHTNELMARLDRAIASENYEEAARLRDELADSQKEVCTHES